MEANAVYFWLKIMGFTGVGAFMMGLWRLGAFKRYKSEDPWRVTNTVTSFKKATKKSWTVKNQQGIEEEVQSEIDPEDALRLALKLRMQVAFSLLAFAALIAILSTIVVLSLLNEKNTPLPIKQNSQTSETTRAEAVISVPMANVPHNATSVTNFEVSETTARTNSNAKDINTP